MGAAPSQPSSDGSGSSTGGGGVTTPEPIKNIVKHETRDCNVLSGKPSSCKFSVPEHWVSELVVTGKENEMVTFRIEALKGLSSKVPVPAPGTQYLNIWPGSKRIQEALIRFRIENSWIVSEGLTSENLRMYRWDGKKWNELETRVLSKDASATNFEAKTDAFAYFAITGPKAATGKGTETTAAPTVTAPGGKPSATAIAPPVAQQPISLVYIIILIGVIAVVAYLYAQTRKKK
ncbi:MAG: PGF-pre-PGF domain-containing protein [Candidatus Methanoperedens sp.]|nr:PGF-pre-PGF domain-containing protein [Candidatus Methanoperedens sp.]